MRTQSASLIGIVVGGLITTMIVRAIRRSNDGSGEQDVRHRPRPPDRDDPRWGPGDGRVQIAGKPCAGCGERITVATEGVACESCRGPCHTKCVTRHAAQAHKAHDDGTPYR